jgi:hypothetical protein
VERETRENRDEKNIYEMIFFFWLFRSRLNCPKRRRFIKKIIKYIYIYNKGG